MEAAIAFVVIGNQQPLIGLDSVLGAGIQFLEPGNRDIIKTRNGVKGFALTYVMTNLLALLISFLCGSRSHLFIIRFGRVI